MNIWQTTVPILMAATGPVEWLRANVGPPIKRTLAPLDQWLVSLPMGVAQVAVLGLFALTGVWLWTLKKDYIYLGAPDQARWRDLRIWATLVLLPYIAVYAFLGR